MTTPGPTSEVPVTASAVTQALTLPRRVRVPGSAGLRIGAPVVLGIVVLGGWQLLVTALQVDSYIVPSPAAILGQFTGNLPVMLAAILTTGTNALVGLLLGAVLGIAGALLAGAVRAIGSLAVPIVAALSVMPIVALAPVLYTMYGAGQETARQLVAALAVLIPVYVTTLRGLRQVRPVHRDLMRSYAATGRQQQWAVVLPTAAPYVFTGLRIASSLAVISALVAEYFGGPLGGLGGSITSAAASSDYALAWAYVLGAIALGLLFYGVSLAVETWFTRHRS